MTGKIFTTRQRSKKERQLMAQQLFARHRDQFLNRQMLENYLATSYAPVSLQWVYKTNAKAATSTVLSFLFALEFGVPFTAQLLSSKDINSDTAVHSLRDAYVFQSVLSHIGVTDIEKELARCFSFSVVRDPAQRVLSAFHYLCASHDKASEKFLRDRLRLSALTGFDWTRHARTQDGFRRFLAFIQSETGTEDVMPVNAHWRPQWRNVQPEILQPNLIGKVEDLPRFFEAVCEHLDRALPETKEATVRNQQNISDRVTLLEDPECRRIIRDIYARDYELFGYNI